MKHVVKKINGNEHDNIFFNKTKKSILIFISWGLCLWAAIQFFLLYSFYTNTRYLLVTNFLWLYFSFLFSFIFYTQRAPKAGISWLISRKFHASQQYRIFPLFSFFFLFRWVSSYDQTHKIKSEISKSCQFTWIKWIQWISWISLSTASG